MNDRYTLHHGDCLDVMRRMEENSIDTVITDPPYGLQFMGKNWDHGIPGERFWAEVLRVAKPGAMLLAFGGTRTFHRLACAIEDAGWIIRDCLMYLYGSGFPKSHDISKALDKRAGAEREVVGTRKIGGNQGSTRASLHYINDGNNKTIDGRNTNFAQEYRQNQDVPITAPATGGRRRWDGWGTALKPAYEPILLCRKPLTTVPFDGIIADTQTLIGGMLCLLLSNANNAGKVSRLSPAVQGEASVSALMLAAVLRGAELGELFEVMDTSNSQEMVSMCLSIAKLWSSILGGVLNDGSTYTTSTVSEMTTGLKTLNYLLSTNIPAEVIRVVSHPVGLQSNAPIAESYSSGEKESTSDIRQRFAAALVSLSTSKSGTLAKSAANSLQPIIPSVVSVLSRVQRLVTTESVEKLKPNYRPVILAMKPLDGTFAENALAWEVAGLNVDGARVGYINGKTPNEEQHKYPGKGGSKSAFFGNLETESQSLSHPQGRWPANLILSDDPEVTAGFPVTNGKIGMTQYGSGTNKVYGKYTRSDKSFVNDGVSDSGSAARFFYCAKASKSERNHGLPDGMTNKHPTVKPVSLCQYLARLTKTPIGGIVLDPFCGSGSIGVGAILEDRQFIGIDQDADSIEVSGYRLAAAVEETRVTQMELELNEH